MSTIKSSAEHLTLNADGASKDIKFQANGVEKASISSSGAFTSTTIDATKLTGNLPAISGAALTGVGVAGISSSADATAMTITSAEKIGIGETAPSAKLHIKEDSTETSLIVQSNVGGSGSAVGGRLRLQLGAQSNSGSGNADSQSGDVLGQIMFEGQGTDYAYQGGNIKTVVSTGDGDDGRANQGTDMIFETMRVGNTGPQEYMRLTSSGHLVFGQGSSASGYQGSASELTIAENGDFYTISNNSRSTGGSERQTFRSAGTQIGVISAGGSATSYGTSSDYRLKENVDYDWDATSRLKQLKPCRFNWIIDETNTLVDGFIAHEAAEVVPESIFGTKDAMAVESRYTENDVETQGDNPTKSVGDVKTYSSSVIQPQQIDQAKLVPLLVKTIQELEARITALEA